MFLLIYLFENDMLTWHICLEPVGQNRSLKILIIVRKQ